MSNSPGHLASGLALVFDMDGVILHSTPLHNRAWELYLEQHAIPTENLEARMLGKRNDDLVRDLFGEHLGPDEVHEHGAAKERLWRDMMRPQLDAHILPGLRTFLESYPDAPKAVVSNAETANIDFVLDGASLRKYFGLVLDGHRVARPKPFPDIYLKAAELLGIPPGDCIVFEDSHTGVQAARLAGARVVGVTSSLAKLPGALLQIPNFEDPHLGEWLAAQQPQTREQAEPGA